jgi:hypothetical protein
MGVVGGILSVITRAGLVPGIFQFLEDYKQGDCLNRTSSKCPLVTDRNGHAIETNFFIPGLLPRPFANSSWCIIRGLVILAVLPQ